MLAVQTLALSGSQAVKWVCEQSVTHCLKVAQTHCDPKSGAKRMSLRGSEHASLPTSKVPTGSSHLSPLVAPWLLQAAISFSLALKTFKDNKLLCNLYLGVLISTFCLLSMSFRGPDEVLTH